jgi:NADPH2:quinone reductase
MTAETSTDLPTSMRQLRSLVTADGRLELSIATTELPTPAASEVLVRVDAAPINPSDLGLLLGMADVTQATSTGSGDATVVTAPIAPAVMSALAARVGESMPVGNEGAGLVVAAGESPEAQALLGKVVGFVGGATYGEYRAAAAFMCVELPEGATAAQGASCFVNPLTALSMVENMRMDGHTALVHTAAASNLGQMLNRICLADGVQLVNIVRRPEQAEMLRAQGAEHVVDSSSETFLADLTQALVTTGATIAFDAIGGGPLAGQILGCMEAAANAKGGEYSRYGSDVYKQVFVYGGLDRGPTTLTRNFGMSWGLNGWLLTPFLGKLGLEGMLRLRQRVVDELTTTFASHYTDEVSLAGMLDVTALQTYAKQATGQKFLSQRPPATRCSTGTSAVRLWRWEIEPATMRPMDLLPLSRVVIHGHEVGYRRSGSGEAVVLIHGLAGSSKTWSAVHPRLAEHHDVIAPDLLGHGESAKPMGDYSLGAFASGLRDFLAAIDVPSATIVGHSFGGGVAMQLAYQHPELCDRLVLVGSGGLGREVSLLLRLVTLPGAEHLMPLVFPRLVADRGTDVFNFLGKLGLSAPRLGEMWRSYSSLAGTENRKAFVRTIRGVIEPGGQTVNALDRLYLAAHLPTLIVWGDRDDIIPVSHAYAAHDAIPGSQLCVLEGVGHFPHAEAPDQFVDVLTDFLANTQPGVSTPGGLRELLHVQ